MLHTPIIICGAITSLPFTTVTPDRISIRYPVRGHIDYSIQINWTFDFFPELPESYPRAITWENGKTLMPK